MCEHSEFVEGVYESADRKGSSLTVNWQLREARTITSVCADKEDAVRFYHRQLFNLHRPVENHSTSTSFWKKREGKFTPLHPS